MSSYNFDWSVLGIAPMKLTKTETYIICPFCSKYRKQSHQRQKKMSININGMYHCNHCGASGTIARGGYRPLYDTKNVYVKPNAPTNTDLQQAIVDMFASRKITKKTMAEFKISQGVATVMDKDTSEWTKKTCICFPYYQDGELINIKYRSRDKEFVMVKDAKKIPFNVDAIKGETECIITEGEFDAMAFHECGFKNVVSVPNGSNGKNENLEYLDDFIESHFDDKKVIYIAVDTDVAGINLRDALVYRFGAERCKIITFGRCKDANDLLIADGVNAVREAFDNAKDANIDGGVEVDDFEPELDDLYENGFQRGLTIGFDEFDKNISFCTKQLLIVTGSPGSGKSEFVYEIAERMNWLHNWRWAFFTPETQPIQISAGRIISHMIGKRMSRASVSAEDYTIAKKRTKKDFFWIDPQSRKIDDILAVAKIYVRRNGIKGLVLDPYNYIESEQGKESETNYISNLLSKIKDFANEHDLLVVLVAHPTKPNGNDEYTKSPSMYSISGSANFFAKTDLGLSLHRDFSNGDVEVYIGKVKNNFQGMAGKTIKFLYSADVNRYCEAYKGWTSDDTKSHLNEKNIEKPLTINNNITNFDNETKTNNNGQTTSIVGRKSTDPTKSNYVPLYADDLPF